jgi:hypothetical protein
VFEILLQYLETGSWSQAFEAVVPKRKVASAADDESGIEKSKMSQIDGGRTSEIQVVGDEIGNETQGSVKK